MTQACKSAEGQETHVCNDKNQKIIEDKEFDLYVETSFPRLFNYYMDNEKYVPCYFCDYCPKSQNLKVIEDDLTKHIETKHQEIITTFDPVNSGYDDWIHEEFMQFFCPE